MEALEKFCPRCERTRPAQEFNRSTHHRLGLAFYCRDCEKEKVRELHEANPDLRKNRQLRKRYGISLGTYRTLLVAQASGCAICGYIPGPQERQLAVDHHHKTGQIRSLLCSGCNCAIGNAREDVTLLKHMIEYLERHTEPAPSPE